ncbi:MAG: dienelactone hydrolase family protein [Gammaproteobacteria bacterium]
MFKRLIFLTCLAANPFSQTYAWDVAPQDVSFTNADGILVPGKLFVPVIPNGPIYPAVVMLHGCSGIYSNSLPDPSYSNVQQIYREWGDRLTAAGYVALLVDSFTPRGTQNECGNGAGVGVSELFDRPKDAMGAYQYLLSRADLVDGLHIGLLGWSHGGSSTMATLATTLPQDGITPNPNASGQPFRVAVSFYPGCRFGYNDNGTTKYAWKGVTNSTWKPYSYLQILHGGADPLYYDPNKSPQYPCTTRVNRAVQQGGATSLTVYLGAQHSFDLPSIGGGTCIDASATPDACAKLQGDAAAMDTLDHYLR